LLSVSERQIEIDPALRLSDGLSTWVLWAKQGRVCGAMDIQVINNRINPLDLDRRARLDLSEKVPPIVHPTSEVIFVQRVPSRRAKRVEDMAPPARCFQAVGEFD